ncbi:MAG: hypothetical protein ACYC4R_17070 [Anaerolineae bacterium]
MLRLYVNYPTAHLTYHSHAGCPRVPAPDAPRVRWIEVTPTTLSDVLARFRRGELRLESRAGLTGVWLHLDFGDPAFERLVAEHLRELLVARYPHLRTAEVQEHC